MELSPTQQQIAEGILDELSDEPIGERRDLMLPDRTVTYRITVELEERLDRIARARNVDRFSLLQEIASPTDITDLIETFVSSYEEAHPEMLHTESQPEA